MNVEVEEVDERYRRTEEFCYVVVDAFLEDENYESKNERSCTFVSLNGFQDVDFAQEEVGRKSQIRSYRFMASTVNSKRSLRKSNIAHFNSYIGLYMIF